MPDKNKILLLVPSLKEVGGVSTIFNSINLSRYENIDHFYVNRKYKFLFQSNILSFCFNYIKLITTLLIGGYKAVHINPSLNLKSFFRDGNFVIIALLLKKNVFVQWHGWQEDFERNVKRKLSYHLFFKYSFAKARQHIVLGDVFKRKLQLMGVKKNVFFIQTSVADDQYLSCLNCTQKIAQYDDEFIILFIARIEKEKGVYLAIDSFTEACNCIHERKMKLIIAGDGPDLKDVKQYINNKKLDNIECTGNVIGFEKSKLFSKSHILLFPTFFSEGLPTVVLEAMLYSLPVIVRSVGAIPEVITTDNGFLTTSLNFHDFVPYIIKLATDKDLYLKIAATNHAIAIDRFIPRVVEKRMLKIYDSCR